MPMQSVYEGAGGSNGLVFLFALSLWFLGCNDSTEPENTPTPDIQERIATALSYIAFAVANGHEGTSFFDNFVPTPRRGIARYVNTPAGRSVTFSGCDLGHGIIVNGTGELVWVGPGLASTRTKFCSLDSCLSA